MPSRCGMHIRIAQTECRGRAAQELRAQAETLMYERVEFRFARRRDDTRDQHRVDAHESTPFAAQLGEQCAAGVRENTAGLHSLLVQCRPFEARVAEVDQEFHREPATRTLTSPLSTGRSPSANATRSAPRSSTPRAMPW